MALVHCRESEGVVGCPFASSSDCPMPHKHNTDTTLDGHTQQRTGGGLTAYRYLAMITQRGRLAWQLATGYGQRALIETTMGRYKALIGPRLCARGFAAQQTEAAIGVAVLNRMLAAGRSKSVRRQRIVT